MKTKQRRIHIPRPVLTELPAEGLFRVEQFIPSIIAVGQSTWWAMVKEGRAPAGRRLSPRVHVWSAAEIREFASGRG